MIPGATNPMMWGQPDPIDEYGVVARSLRLRSAASAYLTKTFPAAVTNRSKWTYSFWVKRAKLGTSQFLLYALSGVDSNYRTMIIFDSNDCIQAYYYANGTYPFNCTTAASFRDVGAWMHVHMAFDWSQAVTADRFVIWINGVRQSFSGTPTYPSADVTIGTANWVHAIGRDNLAGNGYAELAIANAVFLDGQYQPPTLVAQTHPRTGQWRPKSKSALKSAAEAAGLGSFFLPFDDPTNTTTLVADVSSRANNWTANNISLAAGATYDSLLDSPTNNFCVLNAVLPINVATGGYYPILPANGNLKVTGSGAPAGNYSAGTLPINTRTYFEGLVEAAGAGTFYFGVQNTRSGSIYVYVQDGTKNLAGSSSAYGAAFAANDRIGIAVDPVARTLEFFKQTGGTGAFSSQGVISSAFPGGDDYVPFVYASNGTAISLNFGQQPFANSSPQFKGHGTKYMPIDPGIILPSQHFDAGPYVGNGATKPESTFSFRPDFVWIKSRNNSYDHVLYNIVSGDLKELYSDLTSAEGNRANSLSFGTNGWSYGSYVGGNENGRPYSSWNWKGGGAPVSNNAGSIATQVSANQKAGFSVFGFTGTGAAATVGHGLSKAPEIMFFKNKASALNWFTWHRDLGAGLDGTYCIEGLNTTTAQTAQSGPWNNTAPGSSTVTVGTAAGTNGNGNGILGVAAHSVSGYSKVGKYVGNNTADGPMVNCGFRPRWVLIRRTNGGGATNWVAYDTARDLANSALLDIVPNLGNPESVLAGAQELDILSNGFKVRTNSYGELNDASSNFAFWAIAEAPIRYANAR